MNFFMLVELVFHIFILSVKGLSILNFFRRCVRQTALTCLAILTFFLPKESNKEKLFSFQILPLFEARRLITAPALRSGLYEAFKAALPHASSLQPTSLLGNYLPALTSHTLVNRSCLRGADRAIVTPGWLIYFIQKVPFSFLKRWRVSGRRKNFFSFNQEKSFSASLNNFR